MSPPTLPTTRDLPGGTATAVGCIALFLLPFAAVGAFATVQALQAARAGDWAQAGFLSIFAVTFGGVGFGGLTAVAFGRRQLAAAAQREGQHPDEPWLWRADWASHRITDSSRTEMWTALAFAVFWNLVSLPGAIFGVRAALHEGNRLGFLALLFPAAGLGLLGWAARATLRYRRFGTSRFQLATLPAPVGHSLEGTVRTPEGLRPAEGFRVVLSCIRRETTGSGKNRSTTERVLWQEERRAMGGAGGIPVAFAIPRDAAPCDPGNASTRVLWRLGVTGDVPGVDYSATFEVPVFRTAASDAPPTDADRAAAAATLVPADYRQPAGSRIEVSVTRRGTEIYFPPARNAGFAIGLTAFLGIWVGAIVLTIVLRAPILFPIVFGAFGLLLAFLVLDAWLAVTRVVAGDGAITVASGWLVPRRERLLRAAEVADITPRITSQAGTTPYYDVTITTTGGKRVTAGSGVRDKREAEWLAATILKAVRPG
jgi:hypothetical protein